MTARETGRQQSCRRFDTFLQVLTRWFTRVDKVVVPLPPTMASALLRPESVGRPLLRPRPHRGLTAWPPRIRANILPSWLAQIRRPISVVATARPVSVSLGVCQLTWWQRQTRCEDPARQIAGTSSRQWLLIVRLMAASDMASDRRFGPTRPQQP